MTSKLTREQLHERARENVKALKMASRQTAFESAREEILADLQLAELALAAMDSEPVAEVVSIYGDPEAFGEREIRPLVGIQQMPYGTKLYRHAQPAPVVPQDVLEALQKVARIRLDMNDFDGDRRGIADCLGDAEEALIEVVNRRAAMLERQLVDHVDEESLITIKAAPALGSLPKTGEVQNTNDPAIPDGYVMVPKVPSQAHLNSIAMRYRHDFYLLNDAQKDSALATARQMYEECSGQGFYTLPAVPQEVR
ncbi:hypothetical protein [Klebsiella variicola]|uniref:hypothetical protein n=1 Tax=Klebsiella variicola TaxID=244366 RepID=UPI002B062755|nr:hypothetical protein [Klebsiella variicola]